MADQYFSKDSVGLLVRVVGLVFSLRVPEKLGTLWRLSRATFAAHAHEGMYEVLEYDSVLELNDTKGEKVSFHKRQKVRFRQTNIIAFQDQAWGDGDFLAEYRCSPGKAVDIYRDGHRYRILISLRSAKKRGDVEEFQIERTIKGGFTGEVELFQTEVDHPTRRLSVRVIFPQKRFPQKVDLLEKTLSRISTLGDQDMKFLPDGRLQVTWQTDKPRIFEAYILRWTW
jgi:hypothetical protein